MTEAVSTVVENPFRNAAPAAAPFGGDMMASVTSSREVAEVQASMIVARRFPRVQVEVMDQILQACTRVGLAEGALYEFARGGSDIRGPSIRLAETLAQQWGHLDFGWRTLEERPGVTKVQTFCWDLQTGVRSQITFDVTHERMAGGHKKILMDPRDIYEHVANNASRRLRACILRAIPGDVVEAAVKQCEQTLRLKIEVTPERVTNMLNQFAELGVSKAAIERRVQRRVEAMTPGLFHQLGKIYTSLRDGMSQPGDWFDLGDAGAPVTPSPAPVGGAGGASAKPEAPNPRQAVRERLQARRVRPVPETVPAEDAADPGPVPEPPLEDPALFPHAHAPVNVIYSQTLQDVVRFARAAQSADDLDRARHIALQLESEEEVSIAQQHLDAAARRLG